jgi:hypothetical protein
MVAASMPIRDAARDPALAAVHSFDLLWEEKSGTSHDRGDPAGYRVGYGLIAMFCVSLLAGTIGMWNSSQSFRRSALTSRSSDSPHGPKSLENFHLHALYALPPLLIFDGFRSVLRRHRTQNRN